MLLRNFFGHLTTVLQHKWHVFKLCCRVGLVWQGIIHDISKFSYTEFSEGVKYYQGYRSPIKACKDENGYSRAWLHHKGRNKHHYQYWYDYQTKISTPIIPYKYVAEMICDNLAAGIVYLGKDWTNDSQLKYWKEREGVNAILAPEIKAVLDEAFEQVAKYGIKTTITSKNLKAIYIKHCGKLVK